MKNEAGSIIPLGVGAIAATLVIGLLFLELGGIQYQTIRNKQVSDVLALDVAGQLLGDGIPPVQGLDYAPTVTSLSAQAAASIKITPESFSVVSHDGKTVEANFCTRWISITGFSLGNFGSVCASSKARAIT